MSTTRTARLTRRALLGGIAAGGAALATGVARAACGTATAFQGTGPFYPQVVGEQDWDLTHVKGGGGRALGEVIEVAGRVLDTACRPVAGAVIEVWQANAAGRYDHPGDPRNAPLDANFQGYARIVSGPDGAYRFVTVKPGAYPVAPELVPFKFDGVWWRPPHIHFKVHDMFAETFTTQMYFAGEALNDKDFLLLSAPEETRSTVIVAFDETRADGVAKGAFDITINKPQMG